MKIGPDTVVSLTYNLYDKTGELIESTRPGDPFIFSYGGGEIIPGLEKGLEGMEPGATADITVAADEAYGPRDPELIQQVCRAQFPSEMELEVGRSYRAITDGGSLMFFVILGFDEENVEIDMNHPLAGEDLRFEVTIIDVTQDDANGPEGPQLWVPGN